jgi:thymidylate synthase (FAD)
MRTMSGTTILPKPKATTSVMRETSPSVFLIARPSLDVDAMRGYLDDVGGTGWLERRLAETGGSPNEAQLLVEFCGRMCYRSWEPGLNPNVTRIRHQQDEYLGNLLSSLHGSVFEHASFTFAFRSVSRVFTHELVRHRAGSAFSQESLRYVRLTDIDLRVPEALEPIRDQVVSLVERLEEFQVSAAGALGLDEEGIPFSVKKEVTSALRRLAPMGLSTDIVWTANVRTLRHVIEMRTSPGAEEELRLVFDRVAELMRSEAPALFQDFHRDADGAWTPDHHKV